MYKTILVPLDGSEFAEKVLLHVETIARCTGAAVVLLRIPEYPRDGVWAAAATVGYMSIPFPLTEVREDVVKEATDYLSRVRDDLRARGLRVSTVVKEGRASEVIMEYAHTEGVDLIAMSTHGRTGLGRALFGSVAEEVLRGAGKPILLIRPV
jgi:nucleotide-binding universal stress UspA family protein